MWPCPRTRQELITHPSKPSESRIDTLREPWIENELNGGMQEQMAGAIDAGGPPELAWRREFDTVPSNGKAVFGGLKVGRWPRYTHVEDVPVDLFLDDSRTCGDVLLSSRLL